MTDKRTKPAMDPIAREKQLMELAVNLAEEQLRDGTASSATINHFLKLASSREQKEQEILVNQARLVQAKADSIERDRQSADLAQQVIESMKSYSPSKE